MNAATGRAPDEVDYRAGVPISLRDALPADVPAAAGTLATAFEDYPWTRWSIPEDHHAERLEELQSIYLGHALSSGIVLVSANLDGVAALLRPHSPAPADAAQGRIAELLGDRLEAFLAAELPPGPPEAWELATLGVHPSARGQGLGSALLAEGLRRVDAAGGSCTLETSDPRNVELYSRHGFSVTATTQIPDGPIVHSMLRAPVGTERP